MFIQIKNMQIIDFFNIRKLALCGAIFASILCGCRDTPPEPAAFDTEFEMAVGGKPFKAEIALSDAEKAKGLMFRESLAENGGMIFVYDTPQRVSFWTKNTKIPLDLALFTADGTLVEVKKLYPNNLDAVRSSRGDILYCLEMNAGWFSKNSIFPPAKLDMAKLKTAIDARK